MERHTWAVRLLDVHPTSAVLELGCGRGFTAAVVCERLHDGRYVGVDRSTVAIAAAEARTTEWVRRGRAAFLQQQVAELDVAGPFDRVLAVNLNLFWTGPAERELALVRRLLAEDGRLVLGYETPAPDDGRILGPLAKNVTAAGFDPRPVADGRLVGVVARRSC